MEETYPDIRNSVQEILADETYGSPEDGKWTSCSLRNISKSLSWKGIVIEKSTVQRIIKELGYSRQKNRKMEQVGAPSPDRNDQFEFIHSETKESLRDGIPVISVDTKKKENIGNFKNDGTEYCACGSPYETGIKVTNETFDAIDIEYIGPHHGWSYVIKGFKV